jgi:archaeosine-15-forming tRNA-guanine transglycosylase
VFITKEKTMAKKLTKTAQIRAYVIANPTASSAEVAKTLDVKSSYVSTVKWQIKKTAPRKAAIKKVQKFMGVTMATADILKLTDEQATRLADNTKKPKMRMLSVSTSNESFAERVYAVTKGMIDTVNHPPHYKEGGIETIDYIEAKGLGYHLGNAVKYISRAGKKGTNQGLEDLKKAQWYLNRAIEKNEYASPSR